MPRPATQAELLERIDAEFDRLMAEVDRIDAADRVLPGACEDWSVKDLLAHLDAWHELFLGWEAAGLAGERPEMPAPGYGWSDSPALNDEIWRRHRNDPWDEVVARLEASRDRVRSVVAGYDPDALFEKRRWPWTGSTSVGSYAVSATSSHYDWARKLVRAFGRARR